MFKSLRLLIINMVRFFNKFNPLPVTKYEKSIPALPKNVKVRSRPLKFNSPYFKGPPGRLRLLSFSVTNLFKLERIELPYHKCVEVQGYAERVSGKRPI